MTRAAIQKALPEIPPSPMTKRFLGDFPLHRSPQNMTTASRPELINGTNHLLEKQAYTLKHTETMEYRLRDPAPILMHLGPLLAHHPYPRLDFDVVVG